MLKLDHVIVNRRILTSHNSSRDEKKLCFTNIMICLHKFSRYRAFFLPLCATHNIIRRVQSLDFSHNLIARNAHSENLHRSFFCQHLLIFQLGLLKTQEHKIRLAVLARKNYDSSWKGILGHAVKEIFWKSMFLLLCNCILH